MPTNVINVRDLEEEDVKLLESLAERLRAKRRKAKGKITDGKRMALKEVPAPGQASSTGKS